MQKMCDDTCVHKCVVVLQTKVGIFPLTAWMEVYVRYCPLQIRDLFTPAPPPYNKIPNTKYFVDLKCRKVNYVIFVVITYALQCTPRVSQIQLGQKQYLAPFITKDRNCPVKRTMYITWTLTGFLPSTADLL